MGHAFRRRENENNHLSTSKTVAIEHVGSTAIPDIPAKPILDIAIAIPDVGAICEYIEKLKQIGYEYWGDIFGGGVYTFAKGPDSCRTHYVHIVALDSPQWEGYLLFRDYLRGHEEARKEYAMLKSTLAEKYESDRKAYTQGKHEFIRHIVEMARAEMER